MSVEVDKPENGKELDEYVWLLLHEGVSVYIDDDGSWYVEFRTKCTALGDDGRCELHGDHPDLCQKYDPASCVRNGGDNWYKQLFNTPEELMDYWRKRGD